MTIVEQRSGDIKSVGVTVPTRAPILYVPLWFLRFDTTEDEEPDEWLHPSDIHFPNEMDCPNCNRITADAVCECEAIIQHTFKRSSLCN